MKANEYFKQNLEALKLGSTHQARAKYKDGTPATKTSIYNVFEQYGVNELPVHGYRNTAVKLAIQEMLWIYKDQTSSLEAAHKRGIYWWDDFEVFSNRIGEAYGWVVWKHELIDNLLNNLVKSPFSNRHIMSLWDSPCNKFQEQKGGLVPCAHTTTYNVVQLDGKRLLNMQLTIRSSDYITAGAINRVQYYALGLQICGHLEHVTGIKHDLQFCVLTNDLHIYDRHLFAIDELLQIEPCKEPLGLELKGIKNFYDYDIEDYVITRGKTHKLSKELEIAV